MKNFIFGMLLSISSILPVSYADEAIVDTVKTDITGEFQQHGYFTVRPDLRKCVSPLCGGFFVKSVNKSLTRCADGSLQSECYVATVNNPAQVDLGAAALLHGAIRPKSYGDFGNLGVFKLNTAFRAASASTESGLFVGLENNGIVCITTPCFSADQYLLNRSKIRAISGIDLEQVGASKADLEQAWSIIGNSGVLLANGVNHQVEEMTGQGITFVAKQFYLPIE